MQPFKPAPFNLGVDMEKPKKQPGLVQMDKALAGPLFMLSARALSI